MQIEANRALCPACGAKAVKLFSVFHHMVCAYVGPQYDFSPVRAGYTCPKCRRDIVAGDRTCEIVGTSARCAQCHQEMMVAGAPLAGSAQPFTQDEARRRGSG